MVIIPQCVPEQCGKEFRKNLKKASPNLPFDKRVPKIRMVPAFTIQALQKNVKVIPPPRCDVRKPCPPKETLFRKCYQRGEFPVCIEFTNVGKKLTWKVPIEKLDFHHYLPMFFDGLAEGEYPYSFIVTEGIKALISKGAHKILPVVPQIIIPIRNALDTKIPRVVCYALRIICALVTGSKNVGMALVPYYRQLLPVLNLFKDINCNLGGGIDHTATKGENIGDLVEQTLETLERHGGPDAYINIKYIIPTYESCVQN